MNKKGTSELTDISKNRMLKTDIPISLGLTVVIAFFAISGVISYYNTSMLSDDSQLVIHTHDVIVATSDLMSLMKDTETGQRGFIITGDDKYLEPYNSALPLIEQRLNDIERLTRASPEQQARIPILREHIKAKLSELHNVINIYRNKGAGAAFSQIATDYGKNEMDAVRAQIDIMQDAEQDLRSRRLSEMGGSYKTAITSGILSGLLGVLLSGIVAYLIRRNAIARQRQEWLQSGQVGLSIAMTGEQRIEKLGENILGFLSEYFGAQAGAIFIKNGNYYNRVASYGIPAGSKIIEKFDTSDGLLGQAVKEIKNFIINDVPENYLTIGSAMSKGTPRHLLISPITIDGFVNTVIEFGFIHPPQKRTLELLEQMADSIAIAVRSANYRSHLQNLLEETQRQAEELQAQSEELRVSNEELEEQSRALKASQANLELQQAELEQTNTQLEEQTQLLEIQRDDLAKAKNAVQLKAQELEQASRYKSDFLANMSHELRTPLNSSLILAKLLADNSGGNLTSEQVKYAQTIQSSGNDLLTLINDILDLSKIEAGHMEISAESVPFNRLVNDLSRNFEPLAQHKGLSFNIKTTAGCPDTIDTDRLRLEQILRNLISNAIKFTEHGKVELTISCASNGLISFTVTDTGIGIAKEQQQAIFDAFRQADGTISRKYGGTGLGLSISRELTRLLGGSLHLVSEQGKGSSFTLTIPEIYNEKLVRQYKNNPFEFDKYEMEDIPLPAEQRQKIIHIDDDREHLSANKSTIMVVEDDESFARILYDLAHELDFQCLISHSAEDALVIARQYLPSAIVLDVGLPDYSGLSVLDRLKRDPRTRHIPVHVVSANDYTKTAMSLGAIGYMIKPVKREELISTLKQLEKRLAQTMRRVLIVEDDDTQRESLGKLLGSHDVTTVGVGTASECLERLKEETFDCMVLDLTLPDASGHNLLETLSKEDEYSFPPVIVYTGRDISSDEEQRLRRYSKSIIIKGAKSPERLLDEVTLFLHQVVSELPPEQQRMLETARNRDTLLEGKRILVVEDDVRNVYAITSIFEPLGAIVKIARNGREALEKLNSCMVDEANAIDLVLMDVMMPEMDGLTATREIRKHPEWKKLPIIMLTAKAMKDDQERCLDAGANDYMAKPLDVEKLLSLVRVWMPR